MQMNDVSPQEFKDTLTEEYSRAKERVRTSVDSMSKKELKRMLLMFTGVFANEVKLNDKEQQFVEDSKTAMENFIAIKQAQGEIPQ